MIKGDITEDYIDYNSVHVKSGNGYASDDLNNEFISEELLLKPLYKKIEIDPEIPNYNFFPYNDVRVECYCPRCKKRRIFCFENSALASYNIGAKWQSSVGSKLQFAKIFNFKAIADCNHILFVNFIVVDDNHVMKVGQFPSIYDLNEEINNKKFLKLLGDEYRKYYTKACSLFSFDSCIGAMTYLRRIFEKILKDTYEENKDNIDVDFQEFKQLRMDEKIEKLRAYLPDLLFLDGFNLVYTRISDGIHNLSEEECEMMFPYLKSAIEEILIDKLEQDEKTKRRKEIASKINNFQNDSYHR